VAALNGSLLYNSNHFLRETQVTWELSEPQVKDDSLVILLRTCNISAKPQKDFCLFSRAAEVRFGPVL
jgi:hypothetical protein